MSTKVHIDIPQKAIAGFCLRHHIRKLSLFGSVLRDDFRSDSDVDVLVEFEPGHVPGMIRFVQMEKELSSLMGGQRVDLVTAKFLNRRIRDRVLADAEVQYAEG
jgi:predicted nucleotidyltransferase